MLNKDLRDVRESPWPHGHPETAFQVREQPVLRPCDRSKPGVCWGLMGWDRGKEGESEEGGLSESVK